MKIASIQSQILVLPEADPVTEAPVNPHAARPIVILRIGTDDGVEGIAVTFYGGAVTRSLKQAVDDLGALIVGDDPLRLEAIHTPSCAPRLSDRPGLGLSFNEAALRRFAV